MHEASNELVVVVNINEMEMPGDNIGPIQHVYSLVLCKHCVGGIYLLRQAYVYASWG